MHREGIPASHPHHRWVVQALNSSATITLNGTDVNVTAGRGGGFVLNTTLAAPGAQQLRTTATAQYRNNASGPTGDTASWPCRTLRLLWPSTSQAGAESV